MTDVFANFTAFIEVILIDLALSADNAVAVGLAAASLPLAQRRRAVTWGVAIALVLRIGFGFITVLLLHIPGLMLAGGLMLFWIAWRMWADLQKGETPGEETGEHEAHQPHGTFTRAIFSIVLANIALSLDNVLAVAGVARETPAIMAFGLVLSVILMGVAASLIARVVTKHRWIAILGVAAIVLAGFAMAWDDLHALVPNVVTFGPPAWLGGRE